MTFTFTSTPKKQLIIVLIIYLFFASIFGFANRYAINPDGISLLRLAGYIAEGNFQRSITSGWSPLMTWTISPFLLLGFDGLTAARIAIALCGAGLLLCCWFLASRFELSQDMRFIAVLIVALLIAFWTIQFITADVLVAALTLYYIYLVTDPNVLFKKRLTFFCGIIGGFSYLAHHYALPFFLVHFPTLLLLNAYMSRNKSEFSWKKVFIHWGVGLAGFLLIASVWVGMVSAKYGHLTFSAKGGIAHAVMGPKDVDRRHPFFVGGLYKPRDSYAMHVFEDPSEVKFATWSPFESKEYFIHQLVVIKDNFIYILNHFVSRSPFFTYAFVIGILVFIPIAFLLNKLNEKKKFLYMWSVVTFVIYCSGFMLIIARSPRRFYTLMIIFLFLSFHFMEELKNALLDHASGRKLNILPFYLLMIVTPAFALKPGINLLTSLKHIITYEQVNPYREIADQINTIEFPSPYAVIRSSQKPHTDTYIAYYLKKQLLGRPLSRDLDGITSELREAGAKTLLVFDNLDIAERLESDVRYIHIASLKLKNDTRYLHAANVEQDEIRGWDRDVNIFKLRRQNKSS